MLSNDLAMICRHTELMTVDVRVVIIELLLGISQIIKEMNELLEVVDAQLCDCDASGDFNLHQVC